MVLHNGTRNVDPIFVVLLVCWDLAATHLGKVARAAVIERIVKLIGRSLQIRVLVLVEMLICRQIATDIAQLNNQQRGRRKTQDDRANLEHDMDGSQDQGR